MSVTSKTSGSAGSSVSGRSRQTPPNNRSWQTERRLRALALYQKGWQQNRIAEALGVTKGAVSQWIKKAKAVPEEEQERALTVKKSTGRKSVVTAELRRKLLATIDRGSAESFGFVGEQWTATRLQTVIRRELGIRLGVSDDDQEVPASRSSCIRKGTPSRSRWSVQRRRTRRQSPASAVAG